MSGFASGNAELVAGLVIIAALIVFVYFYVPPADRTPSGPRYRRPAARSFGFATNLTYVDPGHRRVAQQLHAVSEAKFEKRRLLGLSEFRVFQIIEEDVAAARRGYRVFAQTSLGEVLKSPDDDAYGSINSKRVDILIVDRGGWPVAAVEYQGRGHYQGTAAGRDAVKREALRKAGVSYIEVLPGDDPDQIRYRVREQLGWRNDAPASHRAATQG
jgi:Protein of unknown function (DUF2726)